MEACLGMQVRQQRRRRTGAEPLPPLPPVQEGQFQEVKTGVLLLPSERVETSPGRLRYDEYLRLGYGIGSGAVESAHKQVLHACFRQAGMRWSEAGARRLLALRLLLLNDNWALLDRLAMVSVA